MEQSFFDKFRNFARDVDAKTAKLELLINKESSGQGNIEAEAKNVLDELVSDVETLKTTCELSLENIRNTSNQMHCTVKTTRSFLAKQKGICDFYSNHMTKYGYDPPGHSNNNKENIPQTMDLDSRSSIVVKQHIKSGLTSIHFYDKDSVPADFHHNGLLVTPGLFPVNDNSEARTSDTAAYFCSPTCEGSTNKTFGKPCEKQTLHEVLAKPKVLDCIDLKKVEIPEEPVLLSRQIRPKINTTQTVVKIFDPTDPNTPLPPSPTLTSRSIDRNIAHGIKKMNLDDSDDDECSLPKPPMLYSDTANSINTTLSEPKFVSKVPKIILGMELPETPELVSVKFRPSAKLRAMLQQGQEENFTASDVEKNCDTLDHIFEKKCDTFDHVYQNSVLNDTNPTQTKSHSNVYGGDRQMDATLLDIPPSPALLSKQTAHRSSSRKIVKENSEQELLSEHQSKHSHFNENLNSTVIENPSFIEDADSTLIDDSRFDDDLNSTVVANTQKRRLKKQIAFVSSEEYKKLPEGLINAVSCERMNSCVEIINHFVKNQSIPVLTLSQIRDDLHFGNRAKDVIVFLLKLQRIIIHKRCSKNPAYLVS